MTVDLFTDQQLDALVDDECDHVIVTVAGEPEHHAIPDDGAPHAPTSECGCGPQRYIAGGHIVYEHVDQDLC